MGAFKKLNQQDAYISTYNARKSWIASGSDYANLGILQLVGETSTGTYIPQDANKVYGGGVSFSDDPDTTRFDKVLLYRSIKQLYYSNFEDAVINTSSSFDNFLQSSFNISGSRELRDSIALFSLPKEIYGTHIEPNSVRLALDTPPPDRDYVTSNYVTLNGIDSNDDQYNQYTLPASDIIDGGYIIDDGEGNLILPESTPAGKKVGNIIYTHGNIIITDDVIAENFNDYFNAAMEWKSNLPIYTHNYHCRVKANELNYSLNKTAIDTNTGQIEDNITGSAFQPYVTTIGLYNDANELIAVAKTPTPIPKSTNTDMSFHIQLDMNFGVNRIDSTIIPTVPKGPFIETLVLYYKFNETTGTTATDFTGVNNGTIAGANGTLPEINQTGLVDKSYRFNYNGRTGEYLTIPNNENLSFGSGAYSIEIWVKPSANFGRIITKRNTANGNYEYSLNYQSGELTLYNYTNQTNYIAVNCPDDPLTSLNWNQIIITYDGSNLQNGIEMYINNVKKTLERADSGTYTGMSNTPEPVIIAADPVNPNSSNKLNAEIDIFRIWKGRELTEAEVNTLYNSGAGTETI